MGQDALNKERALGRIKRLASSGLRLEPFARSVLELLNDGVPHSPNRVILAGGPERIDAYVGSTPEIAATVPLYHQFFVEAPPEVSGVFMRYDSQAFGRVLPSRTIWTQEELTFPDFVRREGYNTVYRPLGWHHLLQVVFQESNEFVGYCPIWRTSDQNPFNRDDVAFLRAAAPHIAHGLKAAQRLQHDSGEADDFAPVPGWNSGMVLMDQNSNPIAIDAQANRIFQQLATLDGATVNAFASRNIQHALAYIGSSLKSIFRPDGGDSSRAGVPVYRLYHHWTGIVLSLRGIRLIGADGRECTAVLVERGETAQARRRRLLVKWNLSEREAEVLGLIAQGKTGPEISILLGIEHDTVRKHTSRIFEKLGVETRTAAAAIALERLQSVPRP